MDAALVGLHGVDRQEQVVGDVLDGHGLRHAGEHRRLAVGQLLDRHVPRGEVRFPGSSRSDRPVRGSHPEPPVTTRHVRERGHQAPAGRARTQEEPAAARSPPVAASHGQGGPADGTLAVGRGHPVERGSCCAGTTAEAASPGRGEVTDRAAGPVSSSRVVRRRGSAHGGSATAPRSREIPSVGACSSSVSRRAAASSRRPARPHRRRVSSGEHGADTEPGNGPHVVAAVRIRPHPPRMTIRSAQINRCR